jgi:hypothetical protein
MRLAFWVPKRIAYWVVVHAIVQASSQMPDRVVSTITGMEVLDAMDAS